MAKTFPAFLNRNILSGECVGQEIECLSQIEKNDDEAKTGKDL